MEWLDEERDERQKQIEKLEGDIEKAVDGIDEKFVDFTEHTKTKFDDIREDWDNEIDQMEEKIKKNSLKLTKQLNLQNMQA